MSFTYEEKQAASRYADVIWRTEDMTDGMYLAAADGCWDMIFTTTAEGKTTVRLSGPSSTTTEVHYKKGNRNFGMRFKQGVFLTHIPVSDAIDVTEYLPMPDNDSFLLGGLRWRLPTFETIDAFIADLESAGLLSEDAMVRSVLEGVKLGASPRSIQRRFHAAVGLTPAYIAQIERAWRAVDMLQKGMPIADVAQEVGYADQAHMTRQLKRVTGYTPRQTAVRREPL